MSTATHGTSKTGGQPMQTYPRPPIKYAVKAAESFLADDADDWNLVQAKKQSKFQVHNVNRKAKDMIPEFYPPMSTLADSEGYYSSTP